MNRIKSASKKLLVILILSAFALALSVIFAVAYVFSLTHDGVLVTATGRNNLDFNVFYFENEFFGENPVSNNLHFLGHFTDFIEIQSSFSADFSDEFDLNYSYTAQKRFVISHVSGGVSSVIHEQTFELSQEGGRVASDNLDFGGGTYIVYPRDYMAKFLNFLEYNDGHLGSDAGLTPATPAFRNFSAALFIEFTYSVAAFPVGITEISMRGFQIPIGDDVFTLTELGSPGFTASVNLSQDTVSLSAFSIIMFVLITAASGFGLFFSISRIFNDSSVEHGLASRILKKYRGEIIISKNAFDLSDYKLMEVEDFEEILKLAVNLNKHIMGYKNDKKAEFCVLVDEHAYYYVVNFERNSRRRRREAPIST